MRNIFLTLALIPVLGVGTFGQANKDSCPVVSILGPPSLIAPGGAGEFSAKVDGADSPNKYEYAWTVSGGSIENGQGTSKATIKTNKDSAGSNILISLIIYGFDFGCANKFTETISVAAPRIIDYFNDYGRLTKYQMRAILDDFFIHMDMSNDLRNQGIIVFDFDAKESRKEKLARLKLIFDTIRFRNYDSRRILIAVAEKPSRLRYTFWVAKSADEIPGGLSEYILLKGENLVRDIRSSFPLPKKK